MAIYLRTPETRSQWPGETAPRPRKPPRETLGPQDVAQAGDCVAGRTARNAAGGRGDERAQRKEVRVGEPRRHLQRLSHRRTRHLAPMTPCPGCCSDPELRVRGEQSIALLFRPASRWTLEQVNRERTRVTVNEIQKFAGHLNCFFLPH